MGRRILLIVAAGKSLRFGGFPKAFCKIGSGTNVDNTVSRAKTIFDKVYIGVNQNTYDNYHKSIDGCEMFSIISGQGDAHSLLKCLNYVKEHEPELKSIYVCWGDAVFVDVQPFKQFVAETDSGKYKVAVACAIDSNPYAWFEVDKDSMILQAHFASENGEKADQGIHDQSLFMFNIDFAIKYLNEYRDSLNIPYNNDEQISEKNEMKLLFSFNFLRERGYELAKCIFITPGKVLSFNTKEELSEIKKNLDY